MTLEDSIHASRVRVLREAERTGNVSATCRRHGVSRTVFYRLRRRFEQYGADGVHPKRRRAAVGRPSALSVQTERRVIAFALAWRTSGPQWLSDQLAREGVPIAPVTVWRLLRRHQLGTRRARLAVLEHFSAATHGILTERTAHRDRRRTRHVAAAAPGDLLSLDTFYVGKLKGVGKVWQITGCDAACSYAWARLVVGEVTAAAVLTFLRDDVRPTYRRAQWRLQRVLTDNGKEFKGAFAAGCERLGVRITRTKPRHAWTNGFVERLQGTILHEH
jgi:transposase InsO family protein